MKKKPKKWIQGAIQHPGAFRAVAKKHGMSTGAFSSYVLSHKDKFSTHVVRQAALAKRLMSMHHGKKKK